MGKELRKGLKHYLQLKKIRNKGLILELYSDALTNSFLFSLSEKGLETTSVLQKICCIGADTCANIVTSLCVTEQQH